MPSAMVEVGFAVPPLAWTYWNTGPGPESPDTDHGMEWSSTTPRTCAQNLFHVARAFREIPIPVG